MPHELSDTSNRRRPTIGIEGHPPTRHGRGLCDSLATLDQGYVAHPPQQRMRHRRLLSLLTARVSGLLPTLSTSLVAE
jgi:hypothetical protein